MPRNPPPVSVKDPKWIKQIRVIWLSVLGFLILFSYGIARPAIDSLFLEVHGSSGLPLVWALVSLLVVPAVLTYNRFVARMELLRLLSVISVISGLLLVLLIAARQAGLPWTYHLLYIWKDIYIVLLYEAFYSFANLVFSIQTARWVYGLFGTVGGIGGICGNLLIKNAARLLGTATSLWFTVPVLFLVAVIGRGFGRIAGICAPTARGSTPGSITDSLRTTWNSSYLLLILLLISLVQGVITLIDYEFNDIMSQVYPVTDARTGVFARIYMIISLSTILLHALTGPILRLSGVPLTLLSIPVLLGCGFGVYAVVPAFATVAVIKVASKCFDYSLLRNAKEMLYIPLSYEEKTQGKALADMLVYRISKGAMSLLLAGLIAGGLVLMIKHMTLAFIVSWLVVTVVVTRRFRRKVSRTEELGAGD